jgi:prepilin-type N-terminal cleavage/methylation domain-containing protein
MSVQQSNAQQAGFTIVEIVLAIVVFGILIGGLTSAYNSLRSSYVLAREFDEAYTVLSACPEVDRALEFNSLGSATNCYPNNSFPAEDGSGGTITYSPQLTVTPTSSLTASDPLQTIPDSKVVSIQVKLPRPNSNAPALQLRMLITRNGIGQL